MDQEIKAINRINDKRQSTFPKEFTFNKICNLTTFKNAPKSSILDQNSGWICNV